MEIEGEHPILSAPAGGIQVAYQLPSVAQFSMLVLCEPLVNGPFCGV